MNELNSFGDNLVADTEKVLRNIGEVVVAFQMMELEVAEVLSALLKMQIKEDKYRIASSMSFSQKVNLMSDLYQDRKGLEWPSLDFPLTRQALEAAESFRNTVVHSFWGVKSGQHWVKAKANLRGRGRLTLSQGKVDIEAFDEGIQCLREIRSWYLGRPEKMQIAKDRLNTITATMANQ